MLYVMCFIFQMQSLLKNMCMPVSPSLCRLYCHSPDVTLMTASQTTIVDFCSRAVY